MFAVGNLFRSCPSPVIGLIRWPHGFLLTPLFRSLLFGGVTAVAATGSSKQVAGSLTALATTTTAGARRARQGCFRGWSVRARTCHPCLRRLTDGPGAPSVWNVEAGLCTRPGKTSGPGTGGVHMRETRSSKVHGASNENADKRRRRHHPARTEFIRVGWRPTEWEA